MYLLHYYPVCSQRTLWVIKLRHALLALNASGAPCALLAHTSSAERHAAGILIDGGIVNATARYGEGEKSKEIQ